MNGLRVLVVEDSFVNRELVRDILEDAGVKVVLAECAEEALEMLRGAPPDAFGLVLMDIWLPGLDGYEAARVIRGELGHSDLPIVAMTADGSPEDRERSWLAGMDGHIAKPIALDDLFEILDACRPAQTDSSASRPSGADAAGAEPDPPGIELRAALGRFGGNRRAYLAVLPQFVEQARSVGGQLRSAIADREPGRCAHVLHKLRGSAATLGVSGLAGIVAQIEQGIAGGALGDGRGLLDRYEAELAAVIGSIDGLLTPPAGSDVYSAAAIPHQHLRQRLHQLHRIVLTEELRVTEEFREIRALLAAAFGETGIESLGRAVQALDTQLVLTEIETLVKMLG